MRRAGPSPSRTASVRLPVAAGLVVLVLAFGSAPGRQEALREPAARQRTLGSVRTQCSDLPGGRFGVSGTPAIDPARSVLYVGGADRDGVWLHALSLSTGREASGWPVRLSTDPEHMHVWGALTVWRGT